MSISLYQGFIVIAFVFILQWRPLKKESRMTRVIAYCFLTIGAVIWAYCSNSTNVERPMVWLEQWLDPLNPFF